MTVRLHYSGFSSVYFTIGSQGYTEVRYDEERKRVVYEPLQLTQTFRFVLLVRSRAQVTDRMSILSNFEAQSPWEMVGEGKDAVRPEEFKPAPPPPPENKEEVKK